MKKFISLLSIILLFFTCVVSGQTTVSIADVTINESGEVMVPVTTASTLDAVGSLTLNIAYDTTKVEFLSIENNLFTTGNFIANAADGVISIGWFATEAIEVTGKLFDLKFNYKEGQSLIQFTETNQITDLTNPISIAFVDGRIGPEPAGLGLGKVSGISGETVKVPFSAVNLEGIGSMGFYIDYDTSAVEYVGLTDDIVGFIATPAENANGQVILTWIASDGTPFEITKGVLANLNFNIKKGITDLTFVSPTQITDTENNVLSIVPTDGKVSGPVPSFGLGNVEAYVGDNVNVPLNAVLVEDLASFTISVAYDTALTTFVGIENAVDENLAVNDEGGLVNLAWFSTTGLDIEDGKIVDLVFNLKTEATANLDLEATLVTDLQGDPITLTLVDGSVSLLPGPLPAELPIMEAATDGTLDLVWTDNVLGGPITMTVVDSTASAWGSHVVRYDDEAYTGLALANYIIDQSYTISADIYIVGEQSADFPLYSGLTIKAATDEFKYYRFVFRNSSSDNGQLRLQGYDGASWHISQYWNPGVDFEALETGWHNFKITLDGNKFYAFIDGKMLPGCPFVVEGDAAFLQEGFPGIYVYNGANGHVTFDNFKVEANQQLEYSIADIQTPAADSTDASQLLDQQVITGGIVTAIKTDDDGNVKEYYIQDAPGAWNGILVYSTDAVSVGDSVRLQGTVVEFYNKTELKNVNGLSVVNSGVELPEPVALATGDVNNEMYEGVLVSVMHATCTEENNNYGEAKFDDGSGVIMTDDAYSEAFPFVKDTDYTIVGVVDYSFNNYKILYRSNVDGEDVTDVEDGEVDPTLPKEFALDQNYPNPFNPTTKIQFSLKVDSKVSLSIYNVLGEQVANLVNEDMSVGVKTVNFNAYNLSSGIYFYRIEAKGKDGSNFMDVKKMTLIK